MHAQMPVVFQRGKYCIRNGSNADLKRGSVFDDLTRMFSDGPFFSAKLGALHRRQRFVDFSKKMYLTRVNESVAVDPWHLGIDLSNDKLCDIDCGSCRINARSQRAKTVS